MPGSRKKKRRVFVLDWTIWAAYFRGECDEIDRLKDIHRLITPAHALGQVVSWLNDHGRSSEHEQRFIECYSVIAPLTPEITIKIRDWNGGSITRHIGLAIARANGGRLLVFTRGKLRTLQ
ncbi:MAG: hypothetical protein H6814_09035 [Phycisphaeraceae bacterium]|nr:hypothetical protein [Phycisphaeraceae bacterium]